MNFNMIKILALVITLFCNSVFAARVDRVDLSDYVTNFTGTIDQTTQLQAAEQAAFYLKVPLYHPGGTILSGYVKFRVPVIGIARYGTIGSVFKSTVTDGTPAFETTTLAIENIRFLGNATTPINAIGLKAGSSASPVNRSYMTNVSISGFATGFSGYGWINRFDWVLITYCNLGAILDTYNSSVLDMSFEQNRQDFILKHANVVHFTRLLLEGSIGETPSIIDFSSAVTINGLYAEQTGRIVPWITVGPIYKVIGLSIPMGSYQNCGAGCDPIKLIKYENVIITRSKIF